MGLFDNFPPDLVPKRVSSHKHYPKLLASIRVYELVSSVISNIIFIVFLIGLGSAIAVADGATLALLLAVLTFTIITSLIIWCVPFGGWVVQVALFLFDWACVVGFISVALLTNPWFGGSGSCSGDGDRDGDDDGGCGSSNTVFGLAVVSAFLHALTSIMQAGANPPMTDKIENPSGIYQQFQQQPDVNDNSETSARR